MRRLLFALLIGLAAAPARADVAAALDTRILPGFARFAEAARALEAAAAADCRPGPVVPAWHAAFDAWMAVADLRLGPSETAALSVAFWPDERGHARRALAGLIAAADPAGRDPQAYAEVSAAARGFLALELLLHDPEFAGYGPGDYRCDLVRTVAADLARQAAALDAGWSGPFAETLRTAGQAGNATFLAPDEALRALYTQLLAGLAWSADSRLGRPLGSFERPRPRLAEAWRSGRSLRNTVLAAEAAEGLARALVGRDLPRTAAAMARLRAAAERIADPGFQDIGDPQARFRLTVLQQAVQEMQAAVVAEVGSPLGIAPGFNAQDGD